MSFFSTDLSFSAYRNTIGGGVLREGKATLWLIGRSVPVDNLKRSLAGITKTSSRSTNDYQRPAPACQR